MKIGSNLTLRIGIIVALLMLYGARQACAQTSIAKSGLTVVRSSPGSKKIEVRINAVRVDERSNLFPAIEWGVKVVTLVQSVSISVDGNSIFVSRSAFADLINPRTAAIKFQKGAYVLEIVGADGADTYLVRLYFNATQITRKMVYSALDHHLGEDTHYWLTVLKDK